VNWAAPETPSQGEGRGCAASCHRAGACPGLAQPVQVPLPAALHPGRWGGNPSAAQRGGRGLSLTRFLFGKTPAIPELHPEAVCVPWAEAPAPASLRCRRRLVPTLGLLSPGQRGSLSRRLAGSSGVCGSRYKLLLDSQQRELPLAKDEKLVSWEEIIFREETDNIPCIHRLNPLLPPLLSAAVGCEPFAHCPQRWSSCSPWLFVSTRHFQGCWCWMCPCEPRLGVLTGGREAPALQLSLCFPPPCQQGRGALCLLIPTLPLP